MLQKEVVDRMVAPAGNKVYGRLSLMLQSYYAMQEVCVVPPQAFIPEPKVWSSVVVMVPLPPALSLAPELYPHFSAIVKTAFHQRRKVLSNSLSQYFDKTDFHAVNINPLSRAEQLTYQDFLCLAALYHKRDLLKDHHRESPVTR